MRGSPLLRAALTLLVLLGLAPFLWQMTRPKADATPMVATPVTGPAKIGLVLSFTTPPKRVSIQHLGKPVWQKERPEAREECELELPWPKEGGELRFTVEWPEESPLAAMRAVLTEPNGNELERSLFGRGPVDKVLGFP